MRLLEELQMNALPALQTFLYDGWVLRFADGYTNRANSINPIYQHRENVDEKINRCEIIFRSKDMNPTYKITPFIYPENLDDFLEIRGYKKIRNSSVQTLHLSDLNEPDENLAVTSKCLNDKWFEHYCKLNSISEKNSNTLKKMLSNLTPNTFFTLLEIDHEVIACGMAVLDNSYLGLFDITVSEKYRNKGYGTQLILNILKVGKLHGAVNAYLQVMIDNLPAFNLYKKLGFKEEYKYFYRVLEKDES
jgi:ribosomal protein S18 acetylase RimI-like enzyme